MNGRGDTERERSLSRSGIEERPGHLFLLQRLGSMWGIRWQKGFPDATDFRVCSLCLREQGSGEEQDVWSIKVDISDVKKTHKWGPFLELSKRSKNTNYFLVRRGSVTDTPVSLLVYNHQHSTTLSRAIWIKAQGK